LIRTYQKDFLAKLLLKIEENCDTGRADAASHKAMLAFGSAAALCRGEAALRQGGAQLLIASDRQGGATAAHRAAKP
jgi:hypothetical protein